MSIKLEVRKVVVGGNYKETLKEICIASEFIDPIDEIAEKIGDNTKELISRPFKVVSNDEIVSFFTIESPNPRIEFHNNSGDAYWLESFFITYKFKGKGYAKAVVTELLQSINNFYPNLSSLYLKVNLRNEIAQNLYKKCGFADTGKIYSEGPVGLQYIYKKEIICANRVAGGFSPPAPTTPCMRIRTGRFIKVTGPSPGSVFSPTVP